MNFYVQDPSEVLLYEFAWSSVLPSAASITASVWTAPAALTVTDKQIVGETTQARISGAIGGERYQISNTVTLSNGETYSQSAFIWCEVK